MYLLIVLCKQSEYFIDGSLGRILSTLATRFLVDFKSLPNLVCAFLIFMGFLSLKERNIKVINWMASGSFAVYVVHQTQAFYPTLWGGDFVFVGSC